MKKFILIACIAYAPFCFGQSKDEFSIRQLLNQQTIAWNNGNIEAFMQGYWKNDSLVFIGKNGPTYGYAQTLANYKKNYPDVNYMGKLTFDLLEIRALNKDHYFVIGKWSLSRQVGNVAGHFTLLLKKINGQWNIIADHSS